MENRKALVAANWKMYKSITEARRFVEELQAQVGPQNDREVVIAPPFTARHALRYLYGDGVVGVVHRAGDFLYRGA